MTIFTADHRAVPVCACVLTHLAKAIEYLNADLDVSYPSGLRDLAIDEVRAAWHGFVDTPNPSSTPPTSPAGSAPPPVSIPAG